MKLWLAPLEGVSDCAFRTLCYNHGADLTFTEMVRVDSILRNNQATLKMLDLKNDTPTVIQLLVTKPQALEKFITLFPTFKIKPAGFNLNLGCPSPDAINQGAGAALVKRIQRVQELVKILKKTELPISIKIRLGLNQFEKEKKVYLNLISEVDADYFIIHPKHARQTSIERCDWSVYPECIATGKRIVANGDIYAPEHLHYFKNLGIKELMLGRAAVINPAIFEHLKEKKSYSLSGLKKEYLELTQTYNSLDKYRKNTLKYLGKAMEVTNG